MNPTIRKATNEDVTRLFEVRRDSILGLAPKGMSDAQSVHWASRLTVEEMAERLLIAEYWVAEVRGMLVGWVGIRGDELCGLYVAPDYANQGIGSELLRFAETTMHDAGVKIVHLEASWNAESFYLKHGYEPQGPRPPDDTRTFLKSLEGNDA